MVVRIINHEWNDDSTCKSCLHCFDSKFNIFTLCQDHEHLIAFIFRVADTFDPPRLRLNCSPLEILDRQQSLNGSFHQRQIAMHLAHGHVKVQVKQGILHHQRVLPVCTWVITTRPTATRKATQKRAEKAASTGNQRRVYAQKSAGSVPAGFATPDPKNINLAPLDYTLYWAWMLESSLGFRNSSWYGWGVSCSPVTHICIDMYSINIIIVCIYRIYDYIWFIFSIGLEVRCIWIPFRAQRFKNRHVHSFKL